MMSLAGRTVVVTGASRGLGAAIAADLCRRGASVWLADVLVEEGERTACALRESGGSARFHPVDLASPASVTELADAVLAEGSLWGLVNNAARADGVGGKLVHEISVEEWDAVLDVNLRGTWLVSRAFAPAMIAAGCGRVVNLGSDAALNGSPRLAHYIASKGGVAALTRAMASDLGPHDVTVNTVAPGLTETEGAARVPAARHQLYEDRRALGRAQVPSDVTGLVAFLLSDEAAYVTGQQLVVNGGFLYH